MNDELIERLRAEAKRNTGNASPLARRARTLCGEAANLLESLAAPPLEVELAGRRPSLLQVIQEMRGRSFGSKSGADAATLYDWASRLGEWFTNEGDAKFTSPPAPSGWQPIESAPRDGRAVLLWAPEWRDYPAIGTWHEKVGAWDSDAGTMEDGPSFSPDALGGPSHWMPLPPAPTQEHTS
jgi:hypothetical protein